VIPAQGARLANGKGFADRGSCRFFDPATSEERKPMQRLTVLLVMAAALAVTSGCASKKFVRNTVQTSSDALTARIETNEGEMKEIRDNLDQRVTGVDTRVTAVDGRVTALDAKTNEGFTSLRSDVKGVDQRAADARTAADRAAESINMLGTRFQNRNQFNISDEKAIPFKFDSASLDPLYTNVLDEIAATLMQNADAIVVLEGRTDSTGNKDYNVRLGERRIEAVKRYLAVEKGVPIYKIHEISYGADKPLAENKTRDGREKNRAVTMMVLTPKSDGSVASRND
jgi:outer membrane protein OmpA-like peptidoglycan-associated protein